jgi:hypothetical protein
MIFIDVREACALNRKRPRVLSIGEGGLAVDDENQETSHRPCCIDATGTGYS